MNRIGRIYPKTRRIQVRRGKSVSLRTVHGPKLLKPKVRKFAKKHRLSPDKSLLRRGSGTWRGEGGRYLVWNDGKLRIVERD